MEKDNYSKNSFRGGIAYRKGNVDLTRFLASLLVMGFHVYLIGLPCIGACWAWVEYFFILSGYFTMVHFRQYSDSEDTGKKVISYVIHKFMEYMPYMLIALSGCYFIEAFPFLQSGNIKSFIHHFLDIPFEAMLLTSSGISSAHLAPIWYLSAMFIVMPVFSWLLIKYRSSWPIWAVLIPILYYGKMGLNVIRTPLNDMLRAFVGMTLGTTVFYGVEWIQSIKWKAYWRIAFTIVELLSLAVSIYVTVRGKSFINLLLISFSLLALTTLSGKTYTVYLQGNWCTFLAKISLVMYLFHYDIGVIINRLNCSLTLKLFLYYMVTFIISVVAVIIVKMIKINIKRRKNYYDKRRSL